MNQFELSPETRDVLDRIRHSSKFLSVFEMPSDLAEAAVQGIRTDVSNVAAPIGPQDGSRLTASG
jgi:hypothetical protein